MPNFTKRWSEWLSKIVNRRGTFSKKLEQYGQPSTSQNLVRREVMDAFEQCVAHNRDLLERLAR